MGRPVFCAGSELPGRRRLFEPLGKKKKSLFEKVYFFKQKNRGKKNYRKGLIFSKRGRYVNCKRYKKACLKKYTFSNRLFSCNKALSQAQTAKKRGFHRAFGFLYGVFAVQNSSAAAFSSIPNRLASSKKASKASSKPKFQKCRLDCSS